MRENIFVQKKCSKNQETRKERDMEIFMAVHWHFWHNGDEVVVISFCCVVAMITSHGYLSIKHLVPE